MECYDNSFLSSLRSRDKILYVGFRRNGPLILYIVKSKGSEIVGSLISFRIISNLFHHTNVTQVWNAVCSIHSCHMVFFLSSSTKSESKFIH